MLYNEETNNTYDVCLKLARDVLTIQKLDVVCTSGTESQVNVSALETCIEIHATTPDYCFSVHGLPLPIKKTPPF